MYNDDDVPDVIWVEYNDENGRPCYYNKETKLTTLETPNDYIEWMDEALQRYLISISSTWRIARSNGTAYYYNSGNTITQWNAPQEVSDYQKHLAELSVKRKDIITKSSNNNNIKKRVREDDYDYDYDNNDADDNYDYNTTYNTTISNNNNYGNWDDDDDYYDDDGNNNTYNNITTDDANQETENTPIGTPTGTPTGTPIDSVIGTPIGTPIDDDNDTDNNDNNDDNEQHDNNSHMYLDNTNDNDTNSIIINEEERLRLAEIKELEAKITTVDAIVNSDTIATVQRLIQLADEPAAMAKKVSTSLSENYIGYAQMTHVLLEWLHCAQEAEASSSSSSSSSDVVIEDQESIAVNEIANIIKNSFNKDKADELIKLFVTSHEASEWFTKLIEDPILRRTLIELYDKNKGSTLLAHSIKMLSSMGYNREIAQIIREVDYIEVFNELLLDLLSRVVQSNDDGLESLAGDLKRMCCHTDFMFAYSHYLLIYIEQLLLLDTTIEADFEAAAHVEDNEHDKKRRDSLNMQLWGDDDDDDDDNNDNNTTESSLLKNEVTIKSIYDGKKVQSIRHKVRRLRQELELTAIWQKRETGSGRLTNVANFGLKLIGLQKVTSTTLDNTNNQNLNSSVWYELLDILKSNSISGIHIDRLTNYYYKGNSLTIDANQLQQMTVPVCFLRDSQIVHLLIDAFIHTSKQLPSHSVKLARLLALVYCYDDDSNNDNTDLVYYGFLGNKSKSRSDITTTTNNNNNATTTTNNNNNSTTTTTKDYNNIAKEITELESSLLKTHELSNGIIKMAYSVLSFDKPHMVVALMVNPMVSMCVLRSAHNLWGIIHKAAMDQITARKIPPIRYPQQLTDRMLFFHYQKELINADYDDLESMQKVQSTLRVAKDLWQERAEEVGISEELWTQQFDEITYALGLCHIYELLNLTGSNKQLVLSDIIVPTNFNGAAYLKAISELYANSENESQKLTLEGIITKQGNVSNIKVVRILSGAASIDQFREEKSEFIREVTTNILPTPEIKYILKNNNLTAAMANMSHEPFDDLTQPQDRPKSSSSSSSKKNTGRTYTGLHHDDDYLGGNYQNYLDDELLCDEDIIATGKGAKSKARTNLANKKLSAIPAPTKRSSSSSSSSSSSQRKEVDAIELAKTKNNFNLKYHNNDPLNQITNKGKDISSNGKRPSSISNNDSIKKPRLTDTRADADKVKFDDDDDDDIYDSDDENSNDSFGISGIINGGRNMLRSHKASSSSNLPRTLRSAAPTSPSAKKPKKVQAVGTVGKKGKWVFDEEQALRDGVRKHGRGSWTAILQDIKYAAILEGRTGQNLKDKYVNMEKQGTI